MYPRQNLNSRPYCLTCPCAGIIGIFHHTKLARLFPLGYIWSHYKCTWQMSTASACSLLLLPEPHPWVLPVVVFTKVPGAQGCGFQWPSFTLTPRERSQFTPGWQSGLISLVSKCQLLGILSHSAECFPDAFCFLLVLWMRNVLQRFVYLSTSSRVGATLWGVVEPLGGTALLEETHHWGWALSVCSLTLLPVLPRTFPFCFLCVDKHVISHFPSPTCTPCPPCVSYLHPCLPCVSWS